MSIAEGTIIKFAQNILLPDEQVAVNVYWATVEDNAGAGPLDDDDVIDACANFLDDIYDHINSNLANTVASTIVEVWTVNPLTGDLTPVGDGATTWDGTGVVDALPNGVAGICSAKTINTEVTGRKFIAGYGDTVFTDNNMLAAPLANLVLYALDWVTQHVDLNDVILNMGVWSQTKLNFYLFTGVVIANAIAGYQRRRKPGVGT